MLSKRLIWKLSKQSRSKETETFMLKVLYSFRESASFAKKVDKMLGEEEFTQLQWQLIEACAQFKKSFSVG